MRVGSTVWPFLAAAIAVLASGCATRGTNQDLRLPRYRPDDTRAGSWLTALHTTADSQTPVSASTPDAPWENVPASRTVETSVVPGDPQSAVTDEPASGAPFLPVLRALHKGDRVTISLLGTPDAPQQFEDVIDENGNVTLPHIGDLKFGGLTTAQAEALVRDTYVDQGIYRSVNCTVISPDDEFYVQGEAKREGRFPLTGRMTLARAIIVAGGYTEYARRSRVTIQRGEETLVFNMSDIESGKIEDPLIRRGDRIVIPRRWFL